MDREQLYQMFMYAQAQARAVKTLFAYHCIESPAYHVARRTAQEHIHEILCGVVPVLDKTTGKIYYAEDRPECIDAFQTVLMNKVAYDRLIELSQLNKDQILTLIDTPDEDSNNGECNHCQQAERILPTATGTEIPDVQDSADK